MADKLRFYVTEQLSDNMAKTPEGYLLCMNVPITRTGEFIYRSNEVPVEADASGLVHIQRDPDEVFREDTLKSFEGKSFTINHPDEAVDIVNWKELTNGTAQNVRRGEGDQHDLMMADILITTEDAIALVESGIREISCGYDADYEQIKPGYGRQKNIVGNHVALVVKGRAGGRCVIQDKACVGCGNCTCGKNKNNKEQEESMDKTLKQKVRDWMKSIPFKDEDDPMEETKTLEDIAKKTHDQEESISGLEKRLAKIEALLKELLEEEDEEETHDEDEEEEKKKKAEEEMAKKKAEDEEAAEEKKKEEEEKEKEKKETADCEAEWPDIVQRVEILSPGIVVKKPTRDRSSVLREIKVAALKTALTRDEDKPFVLAFTKDKEISSLTKDSLNAAFIGASELISKANNAKVQRKSMTTKDLGASTTVRSMNEKNKAFYK